MKRTALLAALLLTACPSAEEPQDLRAPEVKQARSTDLSSLAAMRGSSKGADLEAKASEAAREGAQRIYASGDGEASLVEMEIEAEETGKSVAQLTGLGDERDFASPSDLDKASDVGDPTVNKDLVAKAVRGNRKRLQSCWDAHVGGTGEVTMTLRINTRGEAEASLSPRSRVRDPKLTECVASALERTDFPHARHGTVQFDYPLRF